MSGCPFGGGGCGSPTATYSLRARTHMSAKDAIPNHDHTQSDNIVCFLIWNTPRFRHNQIVQIIGCAFGDCSRHGGGRALVASSVYLGRSMKHVPLPLALRKSFALSFVYHARRRGSPQVCQDGPQAASPFHTWQTARARQWVRDTGAVQACLALSIHPHTTPPIFCAHM